MEVEGGVEDGLGEDEEELGFGGNGGNGGNGGWVEEAGLVGVEVGQGREGEGYRTLANGVQHVDEQFEVFGDAVEGDGAVGKG